MRAVKILLALLLCSGSARAALTFDTSACPTGAGSCPVASNILGSGTTTTASTSSFSTAPPAAMNGIELIEIHVMAIATAGTISFATPTFTGGSGTFLVSVSNVGTECSTTTPTCSASFFAYTSSALTGVTCNFSATTTSGVVQDIVGVPLVFGSPATIGKAQGGTDTGTTATANPSGLTTANNYSFAGFADSHSATSRTAISGTVTYQVLDAANSHALWLMTSPLGTGGSLVASASPAVVTQTWSGYPVEIFDASVNVGVDPVWCPTATNNSSGIIPSCPGHSTTTATTNTTSPSRSTSAPSELLCAMVEVQGVGLTSSSVAISDSGISKTSAGWQHVFGAPCMNGTTALVDEWCAVTTSQASSKTVTATFTATSLISSTIFVVAPLYSEKTLPANFQCGATSSGPAAITITPAAKGSLLLGGGVDSANQTSRTPTTTPQATIANNNTSGATGILWNENAWSTGTSAVTIGASNTATPTSWTVGFAEILLTSPSSTCTMSLMGVGCDASPPIDLVHFREPLTFLSR